MNVNLQSFPHSQHLRTATYRLKNYVANLTQKATFGAKIYLFGPPYEYVFNITVSWACYTY